MWGGRGVAAGGTKKITRSSVLSRVSFRGKFLFQVKQARTTG